MTLRTGSVTSLLGLVFAITAVVLKAIRSDSPLASLILMAGITLVVIGLLVVCTAEPEKGSAIKRHDRMSEQ